MNSYNGELYIFGGKHYDKTAYKYNPATQTYTRLADIPVGFVSAVSVTLGDKIYLVTGRPYESSSTRYNTIYEYNPADDTYRLCNATIHSGDCKGATSYKGYLYIFGGDQNNRTCYRYDPRTDTAKEMKQIPFNCTDTYACATNDAIYLVGSSGSPYALWKYEPGIDSYTQLPDVPISTWGPASGALLNKKYLFAIGDTSSSHNKVQVYTISDKTYKNTPTEGLLIDQYDKSIKTIFNNPIESYFSTVKYYSGGTEIDVEIYYGDGVNWIRL
jgi:N-acetylneuraminic acid mutarotase